MVGVRVVVVGDEAVVVGVVGGPGVVVVHL